LKPLPSDDVERRYRGLTLAHQLIQKPSWRDPRLVLIHLHGVMWSGYRYGQPPHDIASLLIFMLLWRSGTHHENRLDALVQDMQGNK
jgi:hypothetical protein